VGRENGKKGAQTQLGTKPLNYANFGNETGEKGKGDPRTQRMMQTLIAANSAAGMDFLAAVT